MFWPGEYHGECSPWGRKESDTTERLSLSLFSSMVASELSGFLHVSSEYSGNRGIVREGEGFRTEQGSEKAHTYQVDTPLPFRPSLRNLASSQVFSLEASQ